MRTVPSPRHSFPRKVSAVLCGLHFLRAQGHGKEATFLFFIFFYSPDRCPLIGTVVLRVGQGSAVAGALRWKPDSDRGGGAQRPSSRRTEVRRFGKLESRKGLRWWRWRGTRRRHRNYSRTDASYRHPSGPARRRACSLAATTERCGGAEVPVSSWRPPRRPRRPRRPRARCVCTSLGPSASAGGAAAWTR